MIEENNRLQSVAFSTLKHTYTNTHPYTLTHTYTHLHMHPYTRTNTHTKAHEHANTKKSLNIIIVHNTIKFSKTKYKIYQ